MKKTIEIVVPKDYSALTLKKYLKLQDDLKNYEGDTEAQDAFLLYNLCGLTPDITQGLDSETLNNIKNDLYGLLNQKDFELKRKIKIGDTEYGFEPNLSEMPYGAYLDISKFETLTIDDNWKTIMSILYRPIVKKSGALYEIQKYNGVEPWDEEKWLDVPMDVHFGAYFFFVNLQMDLLNATLNSLKKEAEEEKSPHIKSILERSGEVIRQLSN